jgi:uncharacterized protein (DUF305 family)
MPEDRTPSGRWVRPLLGAIAAVLLATLGFVGGKLHDELSTPDTHSAEAGFARDMSAHHAQAVQMAWIAYPKATRSEVRSLTTDIAILQEYQIGVMQTWLKDWHLERNSDRPAMAWMPNGARELTADGLMPGMASAAELNDLRAATGKQVDILFCQLMLRHHLGGIHMVDGVLAQARDKDVRELAQSLRNAQSNEISVMQQLLTDLGGTAK